MLLIWNFIYGILFSNQIYWNQIIVTICGTTDGPRRKMLIQYFLMYIYNEVILKYIHY